MDTETFGAKLELFFITPDQTRNLFQKIFIKHYKQAHNIKQLFCFVVQLMYKTYSMCLTETQKWSKAQTSAIQHVGFDIIQKKNEKTVSPTNRGSEAKTHVPVDTAYEGLGIQHLRSKWVSACGSIKKYHPLNKTVENPQ